MPRPSFQFYPADWRSNAKLRRCSMAARGAWAEILCILHDEDEYGVARYPIAELAHAAGVALDLAQELASKGVLKGADVGAAPYIFRPYHAGKHGDEMVLVEPGDGPVWYSSRMAKDEWVRKRRGAGTRFGPANPSPQWAPRQSPTQWLGDAKGDGPLSPSSSSDSTVEDKSSTGAAGAGSGTSQEAGKPDWWPRRDRYGRVLGEISDKLLFQVGRAVLGDSAGGQISKLKRVAPYRSDWRAAVELLLRADDTVEPKAWFAKALHSAEMDEPIAPQHTVFPEREYRT